MLLRAKGIFISHYQKAWRPKPWQNFVDIKATDGLYKNRMFDEFSKIARDHGVMVGAVHYQRSGIPVKDQAERFLEVAEDADYLANDFEGYFNDNTPKFAEDGVNLTVMVKNLSKKRTLFYSSKKFVQEWMYPHGVTWIRNYPDFWNAQWPYSTWNDVLLDVAKLDGGWEPRLPAGCKHWVKWQYGAEYLARGEYEGVDSEHVCLEVFNGTVKQMHMWANIGDLPPVEEPLPLYNYELGWNDALDNGVKLLNESKKEA